MATKLICDFCNNEFTTKKVLENHQMRAKYCIKIQKSMELNNIKEDFVTCLFCNKNYSSDFIKKHMQNCKVKKENDIKEIIKELEEKNNIIETYKKTIVDLEQKIKILETNIANVKQHNQIKINIIDNLNPITCNDYDELNYLLTHEHVKNNIEGYVSLLSTFYKNRAICTDLSRKIVKYKDESGNIITDAKLYNSLFKVFKSIYKKNIIIIDQLIYNLDIEYENIIAKLDNQTSQRSELVNNILVEQNYRIELNNNKILKNNLLILKTNITEISENKDNNFRKILSTKICSMIYNK